MGKPLIAVTMGDPAGIGPEIVARALASKEARKAADCVVVGSKRIMEMAAGIAGAPLRLRAVKSPVEGEYSSGILNIIDLDNVEAGGFAFGRVSGACGRAAFQYIEESCRLAMSGKVAAVATAPINKESLRAGNVGFIGHTEIFGALAGAADPLTMFETGALRVFFLTRHVSMRAMLGMIKKERIVGYARHCAQALRRLGAGEGTMAIAALNPHGGEHGLFGDEEAREIAPAVGQLRSEGYDVAGPIPADSAFHQAAQGKYSSVPSLYHDQGHIAAKTLDFERTISITCGMPILRTSVDHGTAFDIAGTGKASAVSMIEAIKAAAKYAPAFSRDKANSLPPCAFRVIL